MALDDEHGLSVLEHWLSDQINGLPVHLGRNDCHLLVLPCRRLRPGHLLDVFDPIDLHGQSGVIGVFGASEDEVDVEFLLVDNGEGDKIFRGVDEHVVHHEAQVDLLGRCGVCAELALQEIAGRQRRVVEADRTLGALNDLQSVGLFAE